MASPIRKISYEEFETLCERGQIYSGLVDGLGLVSWKTELIYFVKIQEPYKPAYYKQISSYEEIVCRMNQYETKVKTKYNLLVTSPAVLKYTNPAAYHEYYPISPLERDAIKDYTPDIYRHSEDGTYELKKVMEAGTAVEDAIGLPLGIAEELSGNSLLKRINAGLTAISIINDISDGNYISATGKTIKAFSGWYGIAWDIGVAIYESERFIIDNYWSTMRDYYSRRRTYERTGSNWDYNRMNDALKKYSKADERYRELMQKKYGPYYWKRNEY